MRIIRTYEVVVEASTFVRSVAFAARNRLC